jgi:ABC-type ATPase involved in cell division
MIALKNVVAGTVLKEMSLAIRPKECVCITGKSSAELGTLFRILGTLEKPTSGTVEVDNVDMAVLPPAVLQLFRTRLGLVFDPPLLIDHLTAGQNIALPLHLRGLSKDVITKAADDLLKRLGLATKAGLYPQSLNAEEKQLTCLARCLIAAPLVIIALEPFHELSEQNAFTVANLFQNLRKKGATIIFLSRTTHAAELMGVKPVLLADGQLQGMPTYEHVELPDTEEAVPVIPSEPDAQEIPVTHAMPKTMPNKPNDGNTEGRKIRITPIGSGLS